MFDRVMLQAESPAMQKQFAGYAVTPLDRLPIAMAYVPYQPLDTVYEQETALKNGTLFPNLDKPFLGKKI